MMDNFDRVIIVGILILLSLFSYAVVKTASDIRDILIENIEKKERVTRAQECQQYYYLEDDTQWMECMGVGYVKESNNE